MIIIVIRAIGGNLRPDEKGIETFKHGSYSSEVRVGGNLRPDEKGIETHHNHIQERDVEDLGGNLRPDEKGIETALTSLTLIFSIFSGNLRPDEKGIETLISTGLFSLSRAICGNLRPDEKGIETWDNSCRKWTYSRKWEFKT